MSPAFGRPIHDRAGEPRGWWAGEPGRPAEWEGLAVVLSRMALEKAQAVGPWTPQMAGLGGRGRGRGEAEAGVIIISLLINLEVSGARIDGSHSGSFRRMQSGGGWAWVSSKVPPTAVR